MSAFCIVDCKLCMQVLFLAFDVFTCNEIIVCYYEIYNVETSYFTQLKICYIVTPQVLERPNT